MNAPKPKPHYIVERRNGKYRVVQVRGPDVGWVKCKLDVKEDAERACEELNKGTRR